MPTKPDPVLAANSRCGERDKKKTSWSANRKRKILVIDADDLMIMAKKWRRNEGNDKKDGKISQKEKA